MVSSVIVIIIGIAFVIIEMFLFTMILLWIGVSLMIVGTIGMFHPIDFLYQLLGSFFLAFFLMLILNNKIKEYTSKSDKDLKDDFCNEEGVGEIQNGLLYYKGTYWQYISQENKKYHEGDNVKVKKIEKSTAYVE